MDVTIAIGMALASFSEMFVTTSTSWLPDFVFPGGLRWSIDRNWKWRWEQMWVLLTGSCIMCCSRLTVCYCCILSYRYFGHFRSVMFLLHRIVMLCLIWIGIKDEIARHTHYSRAELRPRRHLLCFFLAVCFGLHPYRRSRPTQPAMILAIFLQ